MYDDVKSAYRDKRFADVIAAGRAELAAGRESCELLILMAAAAQLVEPNVDVSLEDAKAWLQRATLRDPMNVEAVVDLAIFLDVVDARPDEAAPVFASGLQHLVEHLETFADGLEGALSTAEEPAVRDALLDIGRRAEADLVRIATSLDAIVNGRERR